MPVLQGPRSAVRGREPGSHRSFAFRVPVDHRPVMVTAHAPCHRVTASRAPDTHLHSQPGRTQRGGPRVPRPWPASPACRWRAPRPSSATHGNVYFFFRAKKGKERRKKGVLSGGESLRMFKQMARGAAPLSPPAGPRRPPAPGPPMGGERALLQLGLVLQGRGGLRAWGSCLSGRLPSLLPPRPLGKPRPEEGPAPTSGGGGGVEPGR